MIVEWSARWLNQDGAVRLLKMLWGDYFERRIANAKFWQFTQSNRWSAILDAHIEIWRCNSHSQAAFVKRERDRALVFASHRIVRLVSSTTKSIPNKRATHLSANASASLFIMNHFDCVACGDTILCTTSTKSTRRRIQKRLRFLFTKALNCLHNTNG